jgi:non-histone protein 10
VAAGNVPPPLPPSVEEAYRKKCIELKRRMTEVEESNDAYRLRKARLTRGIRKMRLERAYLLEILSKRMKKNGSSVDGFQAFYDEDSEGSSEGPPTVRLRISKSFCIY